MQRIVVRFGGKSLDIEVPNDRLLGHWVGPDALTNEQGSSALRQALEHPIGYPALRQIVVPGDRVAIAADLQSPEVSLALAEVVNVLRDSDVESISLVSPRDSPAPSISGLKFIRHQPDTREQIAYLASTRTGERVYLNRELTEADCVLVIGCLGFDERGREVGPWSLLSPALADLDALRRDRSMTKEPVDETAEIAWLLGNPFQIALLPGAGGLRAVFTGTHEAVREASSKALASDWTFRTEEAADLVVSGVGDGRSPTTWDAIASALLAATRLVRRGGRVVLLSEFEGEIGPALQRVIESRDQRNALQSLRGRETEADWPIAHRLAEALRWADLFLLSKLNTETVDSLGICPLDSAQQAARLVKEAPSCLFIDHADRTRTQLADDPAPVSWTRAADAFDSRMLEDV